MAEDERTRARGTAAELAPAGDALAELLGRSAARGAAFSRAAAEALVAEIDRELAAGARARVERWAARLPADGDALASWVRARVLGLLGETDAAIEAWGACFSMLPGIEPEGLLHRARALLRLGRAEAASSDLRLALQQPIDYDFWTRAEKLHRRLVKGTAPLQHRRALRAAVLSGKASIALFAPLLRLAAFRDHVDLELFEGDYDSYVQDIVDPQSRLYAFRPEVVILPTHWRDAGLPAFADDPEERVAEVVGRTLELWQSLRQRLDCTIVAHTFDVPPHDPYGRLGTSLAGGRGAMLRRINATLAERARADVVLVDLEQLAASGRDFVDPKQWHLARQHPGSAALPSLVEAHMAVLRGLLGLTRKVLVLDLDNTLWGGVIGEDGLEHIQLGPTSPSGEAFQEFQRYVKQLQERGVLLAVCSKNNEADAKLPFTAHSDTVLRLEDFVAFVANWEDKVGNLRQIAQALSLGLDSFVFVDDNPVERAWVRSQLPEVMVPEMPRDPSEFSTALARAGYFEAIALSAEDRARSSAYRANVERELLRSEAVDLGTFLRELGMVAEHGSFDEANLPRIAQLVNKTNQFNLTTRRYTEAQLRAQANDPRWWTRWFRLRDRYGDKGLIGVLTCAPRAGDENAVEIDNWLMSCRVLGRTMEGFMLRVALEHLRRAGVKTLYGRYLPTAKNAQVKDLLPRFGARLAGEGLEQDEWVIDVSTVALPETDVREAGAGEPG